MDVHHTHSFIRRAPASGAAHWSPVVRALFVAALCAAALGWLWLSLVAIANHAFRYPAFDQYHFYPRYLSLPFPQDAIQLENGHRPVFPILIRLAEIRWFHANQRLQIGVGCAEALLTLGLVVWTVARESAVPPLTRAACVLFSCVAVFWLGNARMLMHGNEALHVYGVMLFTVLAILAMQRAVSTDRWPWSGAAALCCTIATFSFGSGIASFVAIFLIAAMRGLRWRTIAVPAATFVAVLGIYLFALPGGDSARPAGLPDPLSLAGLLVRWLSAPWMRAWLGYAASSVEPSLQAAVHGSGLTGALLVQSASALGRWFGDDWLARECIVVGGIGVTLYGAMIVGIWRNRTTTCRTGWLAIGLSTFALITGMLVCIARSHGFATLPNEIFADRYLPWSCLFWLGIALHAASRRLRRLPSRGAVFATAAAMVAILFYPSDRALATWSAIVHRNIQQSAVAAQLGIWDPTRFPDGPDARRADVLDTLERLKAARLSMFAERAFALVRDGWQPPSTTSSPIAGATAAIVREFHDTLGQREVAAFEGVVPKPTRVHHDSILVVVDGQHRLRGLGKFGFIGPGEASLRRGVARARGFDGYVLEPEPGEILHILLLDPIDLHDLGSIALTVPVASVASP